MISAGVERSWAGGAVRMTLGRTTTDADVDRALEVLVEAVTTLRRRLSRVTS